MSPPAVTFDLWHTLLFLTPEEEDRYMERQLELGEEVLARAEHDPGAPELSGPELRAAFQAAYLGAIEEAARGVTVTPAEQVVRAGRRTGRQPNLTEYRAALAALVAATPFRVAPGAIELLHSLSEEGYRLGVISNTVGEPGALFRPLLRAAGFDRFVGIYTFSDEHPWTKPSPEIFHATLAHLEVPASEAVHVGDGASDVEGSRRAGFRAGILFTGLQEYGRKYRELFASAGPAHAGPAFESPTLDDVGRIVRELLPVAGEGRAREK
ncbi:MAG: HAD family hydrolase [Thermoplasmata archaeon]|nr:HAD family hydrolase [Thermoplasmata archaeon]